MFVAGSIFPVWGSGVCEILLAYWLALSRILETIPGWLTWLKLWVHLLAWYLVRLFLIWGSARGVQKAELPEWISGAGHVARMEGGAFD